MSYILEALKKADQERGIGAVPNLATPHEDRRPTPRSYRWVWVVLALLVVNAVLLALLLKDRAPEIPVVVQAPIESPPPVAGGQAAQPAQQAGEVAIGSARTPEKTGLPENARAPAAGKLVMLPEPADLQNSVPSSVPTGAFPEKRLDQRMDATATAKDNSQLQSWYELPPETRSRLDLPRLDLHVYSDEPGDRFILVNLKKYREGETLDSGLVLEEILPDGMVMSYRGERFRVEK